MKCRRAFALLLALVSLLFLPSCTEPSRGVVLWHPYRGDEEMALKKVVRRFEEEHGVKVTTLAVPYEAYLAKLQAAIPRGNGPDVFVGPHNRLGEYVLHRLVAPVADAFPDADVDRYEPVTVRAITYEGSRYAVPLASKCIALYYSTRIFSAPPTTLGEIARAKEVLPPGVWPLAYESHTAYYHAVFLHAYGGSLFDDGGFAMTGDAAERSLEKARELVATRVAFDDASGDLVKTLFATGKAAAVLSGPWLASDLGDDVPYAVAPLPILDGVGPLRPFLTVDGAFLTPEGAESAEARSLARSLGGDASAFDRATLGKQVVATKSYWTTSHTDTSSPEAERQRQVLSSFFDAGAEAVPLPVSTAMNPVWVPAEQAIRKVLRGDARPREALAEAKSRYDDVMRPPPPSPSPSPFVAAFGIVLLVIATYAVRRVKEPTFRRELAESKPAYAYVVAATLAIVVLVVLPLLAGALTSLFAGTRIEPRFVGLANYVEILTARGKPLLSHGSFYWTLLVTVAWTVINVAFHVGIGLVLGIALARPFLRLRAIYRVLLILPWAVPSYVTALAWKGMFHRQFGAINALLGLFGGEPISWFSKFSTAFTANIATNVWLGFPFMMVVVMGALTSIPKDVYEAAEVDGASRWQVFRLVTLPLVRPTLLPAVVLGSVWTFNMFNVVFLVSGGEPDGTTDILVSEAYRWAFAKNAQFGYAAAYAVIIFGLLALTSRVVSRASAEKGVA